MPTVWAIQLGAELPFCFFGAVYRPDRLQDFGPEQTILNISIIYGGAL